MKNLTYSKAFVKKSNVRISSNRTVASFYKQKATYESDDRYLRNAKALELCLKYWDVDYFRLQAVKDVKRVNSCRDLFCRNCQHNISLKRFAKYSPILDDISKDKSIYHIVFTVPNCSGIMLRSTLNKMYKKFPNILRYFNSTEKSRKFDFTQFGYVGAVRSLEVTTKLKNGVLEFHPHFHCIFVFKNDLDLKKVKYNKFSFSNKSHDVQAFSNFEIFLQKMWFLIFNDLRFNEKNFNELKEGYSVKVDKCKKGQYHEVFKYALGGILKKDLDMDFDTFNYLYNGLYRRKIIQGYGVLNKFEFDAESDDEVIYEYFAYRERLEQIEKPTFEAVKLEDVLPQIENGITYISKFRKEYEPKKKKKVKIDTQIKERMFEMKNIQSNYEEGQTYTYKVKNIKNEITVSCDVVILKKFQSFARVRISKVHWDKTESQYYTHLKEHAQKFSASYELLTAL